MHGYLDFSIDLALKAGKLLEEFYTLGGLTSSAKPDQTVVTEADYASDAFITQALKAEFPDDQIISEESQHFNENSHSPTWVVDPLDGTTNFSLGLPLWGVSIARLVDGLPQLGVFYLPRINELYTVEKGYGAFLNQAKITTRAPDPSQPMSFFACCSRTFRHYNISIPYKPRIMGSAAYTFCLVARGSALLGFDAAPKIWDLAAAWLLVEEAGGTIAAFEGSSPFPIATHIDFSTTSYPTLASATPGLYEVGEKKIQKR